MPADKNPGEELRELLASLYPRASTQDLPHYAQRMDNDLECEGELEELIYYSSLNYILRRLLKTAEYYRRQFPSDWRMKLKGFLRKKTKIRTDLDELIKLISRCLTAMDDEPTQTNKNRVRRQAREGNHGCYLCGYPLDHGESELDWSPTVDHVWPRGLGGASERENLCTAHQKCNGQLKQDYVDASDYHYEHMFAVTMPGDPKFHLEMTPLYKMAVMARSNFKCIVCDQPAFRVGPLQLGRIDSSDSWHFLNLQAYCDRHQPE